MNDTRRRYKGRVAFATDREDILEYTGIKLDRDKIYKFVIYGNIHCFNRDYSLYRICKDNGEEDEDLSSVDFIRVYDPPYGTYFVLNSWNA